MYTDKYDDFAKEEEISEIIEKEMLRVKSEAVSKLSPYSEQFLNDPFVFAFAYLNGNEDAVKLAQKLDLGKMDILAIDEDFEAFKSVYIIEIEKFNDFDLEGL